MLGESQKNILIRALRLRMESGERPEGVLAGYKNLTEEEKAELLKELEG